ncbi:MAG: Polyamine-transporting ATPase [Firmicutes bacterium]|nr:Polyamine-transporting ATPase [Bacillota bacterium]
MKAAVIDMAGVKVYREEKLVLDVPALQIASGELISVIGPNGAGKSTLLQTINLLLPYREGRLRLFGENGQENLLALRRRCAMVFQEPLFLNGTVFANVALPLRLRNLPGAVITERIMTVLDMFHCSHLVNRQALRLSGGEAKRVCLARAVVCEPELLLLDEPFAALDPATRKNLLVELRQAAEARAMTVVFVSHNLNDVLQFTERVIVMEKGTIVQEGHPGKVIRRPASRAIAELAGMDNILPCKLEKTVDGNQILLGQGRSTINYPFEMPDGAQHCCLPGDIFEIDDPDQLKDADQVRWTGMVRQVIPGIGVFQVVVEAEGLILNLRLAREQAAHLVIGQVLHFSFNPAESHLI